jgi:hypothetical protein
MNFHPHIPAPARQFFLSELESLAASEKDYLRRIAAQKTQFERWNHLCEICRLEYGSRDNLHHELDWLEQVSERLRVVETLR